MDNLSNLVHEHVTNERPSESGKLYPSSLGGCIRAEMFRFKREQAISAGNEPPYEPTHPMDPATRWKLRRYGWYEQAFLSALRAQGRLIEREDGQQWEVGNDHWHGKLDALFRVNGQACILEIKSVSPYAPVENLPYEHHKLQAWCYDTLVGNENTLVFLAYITRWKDGEVPDIRVFDVTPGPGEIEEVMYLMLEYERWSQAGGLPPKPWNDPEEHPFYCTINQYNKKKRKKERVVSCQWFGHCWPNYLDVANKYVADEYLPF